MDMRSREQYLESVRQEYRQASRKQKTKLLNEARKRTRLHRKVLIRKLAHPGKGSVERKRRARKATYGPEVVSILVKVWEMFDYPCGQRLVPAMRTELGRLRKSKDVSCSDEIAGKLGRISRRRWTGCWRGRSRCGICEGIEIRRRTDCCTNRYR